MGAGRDKGLGLGLSLGLGSCPWKKPRPPGTRPDPAFRQGPGNADKASNVAFGPRPAPAREPRTNGSPGVQSPAHMTISREKGLRGSVAERARTAARAGARRGPKVPSRPWSPMAPRPRAALGPGHRDPRATEPRAPGHPSTGVPPGTGRCRGWHGQNNSSHMSSFGHLHNSTWP